jgi:hypothetical protein
MNADSADQKRREMRVSEGFYSTACKHADGTATEIRVHISPGARKAAEQATDDSEELIKGCVWRFIYLKCRSNEIKAEIVEWTSELQGDVVEFTIDEATMMELIDDLRKIRLAKREVCRTSKAKG